jgi:hypothetical protein
VACNDQTGGDQSQVAARVTAGKTYYIEVAGYFPDSFGKLSLSADLGSVGLNSIFSDDFEVGDFSKWAACSTDSGDLQVNHSAAIFDNYGMQALIDDTTPIYCTDTLPFFETQYRARFHFDPNSISMAAGDTHVIFGGYREVSDQVVRVLLRRQANSYQARAGLVDDGSTWMNSNWFNIKDGQHAFEIAWKASSDAEAKNGELAFWIDGNREANLTGIDNYTLRIDQARLGAVDALDDGTRGIYFFDAFESRRESYIGPESLPVWIPLIWRHP